MEIKFSKRLISLAQKLNSPLYAVGGVVRNYLIDGSMAKDIDLASTVATGSLLPILEQVGFSVVAQYPRTGTIVFKHGAQKYEYTAFRKEIYAQGGAHSPIETQPTSDILEDALRRDFKCNAIYYDILNKEIVDPLGGVGDIKKRVLDTVKSPEKVFVSDGLRLMRLARFAGELNFYPTEAVIDAMKKYADNVNDVSPERVYDEFKKILVADKKYAFSNPKGHYVGLKILERTKVLDRLFPDLTLGRGMAQRADFHKYDVLEHSLRCALYAPEKVRLAALLHDVGKPLCYLRDGKYHYHAVEGEKMVEEILRKFKADKATIRQVKYLVKEHMVDLDCSMRENKVRLFLVKNAKQLDQLLQVKQADFRASLESDETAPTIVKWNKILTQMKEQGAPLDKNGLKITAQDLMDIGFLGKEIGLMLDQLLELSAVGNIKNDEKELKRIAKLAFEDKLE